MTDTESVVAPAPAPRRLTPAWPSWALAGATLAVVIGVVLRFIAATPFWLDEALSANIAAVDLGDLSATLRRDGHPPLYYVALKIWTAVFGDGDAAHRALSGAFSVGTLPLAFIAGRRLGGRSTALAALVLFAASPFAIRYATETRMYALVSLLALTLWILVDQAQTKPTVARLAGITVVTAALLYTHYWAIWLLGTGGLLLLWAAAGRTRRYPAASARRVIPAVILGGLLFLPWLPVLLHQAANTGTPWGERSRPAEVLATTLFELGGGPRSEAQLVGVAVLILALFGLFGHVGDEKRFEFDVRTAGPGRVFGLLVAGTLFFGGTIGFLTNSTYQPRYAAVIVPFILLLAARGVTRFRGPSEFAVLGTVALLGLAAAAYVGNIDRSQSDDIATAIEESAAPGDVVIYCPDQLGPSTSRYLDAPVSQYTFPQLGDPRLVDWTDYETRNRAADPVAFAADIDARAQTNAVWIVLATTYLTFEGKCEAVVEALSAVRPTETVIRADGTRFEPAALLRSGPAGE